MKNVGEPYFDRPPCVVCGCRAAYEHEGQRFCSQWRCQLVAAGQWTIEFAQRDLGLKVK